MKDVFIVCLYDSVNIMHFQVGMATNIPPHNLAELVDALSVLIHNPEATVCIEFYCLCSMFVFPFSMFLFFVSL